jgi:hypothetical protein
MAGERTACGVRTVALMVALLALGLGEQDLRADTDRSASLSWVALPGAESCAGASLLAREVERRLHRHALFSVAEADVSIEGRVEPLPGSAGWRAVVQLRDRGGALLGSRSLDGSGPSCDELRKAVALAIALMIDPDALLHSPTSLPEPVAATPPPVPALPPPVLVPVPPSAPAPPPAPASPEPARAPGEEHLRLTAAAELGFGVLPTTAIGARAGVAVKPRRFWEVEIYGGAWASQTVSTLPGTSTDFSFIFGGLAVCPFALGARGGFEGAACAAAEVGSLASASSGFATSHAITRPTSDLVASARALVPLALRVALEARAEGGLAVLRNAYVYLDSANAQQSVFDRPLFNARLALGLTVDLQ